MIAPVWDALKQCVYSFARLDIGTSGNQDKLL